MIWRCSVCEGVNQGGRTCATCGATVPPGETLRTAVRTRMPTTIPGATAPVPPTTSRREMRAMPSPDELEVDDLYAGPEGVRIVPMPGGCLMSFGPRRRH